MRGIDVFCPAEGQFVNLQIGLLAYVADRPERHAILNTVDGDIFGQRMLWSAVIDRKKVPYCNAYFSEEIKKS